MQICSLWTFTWQFAGSHMCKRGIPAEPLAAFMDSPFGSRQCASPQYDWVLFGVSLTAYKVIVQFAAMLLIYSYVSCIWESAVGPPVDSSNF